MHPAFTWAERPRSSTTAEGFTPRNVSRRPRCGSPAPAKRMLRILDAVTGLGEPHQVLHSFGMESDDRTGDDSPRIRSWRSEAQTSENLHGSFSTIGTLGARSWPRGGCREGPKAASVDLDEIFMVSRSGRHDRDVIWRYPSGVLPEGVEGGNVGSRPLRSPSGVQRIHDDSAIDRQHEHRWRRSHARLAQGSVTQNGQAPFRNEVCVT